MADIELTGSTSSAFEPLREVMARMVAEQPGGGLALSIVRGGRTEVDLWGGGYRRDSVQLVFSIGKGVTAIAAAMAEQYGLLDLDGPLADYWPEFRRASVETVTPRMVLSHRSGLVGFSRQLGLEEILAGADDSAIAAQEPFWEPGSAHGYHAFTLGTLMNGVFRRALGIELADFVRDEMSSPLGLSLWFGVPEADLGRVAPVVPAPAASTPERRAFTAASGMPMATTGHIRQTVDLSQEPRFLQASFPAVAAVADARSLARLWEATRTEVDGVRLLDDGALDRMIATRSRGIDRVLGIPTHFGTGMQRPFAQFPMLSASSYGHEAAGGSIVFSDPDAGLSLAVTTTHHPSVAGASPLALALLPTVRLCLDEAGRTPDERSST